MGKDDQTWLNICFVAFALLCTYIFYQAGSSVGVQYGWPERYDEWYQFGLLLNLFSLSLGFGALWKLRASKDRVEFLLSAIGELRKVLWPSFEDTKKMTWIVAIVVTIFSIILGVFDAVWSGVLRSIIS